MPAPAGRGRTQGCTRPGAVVRPPGDRYTLIPAQCGFGQRAKRQHRVTIFFTSER